MTKNLNLNIAASYTYFVPRSAIIQHCLGLMTGINDNALDKIRVLQHALPQQKILRGNWHSCAIWMHNCTVKPVE